MKLPLNLLKIADCATIPKHPLMKELPFSVIPSVLVIHDTLQLAEGCLARSFINPNICPGTLCDVYWNKCPLSICVIKLFLCLLEFLSPLNGACVVCLDGLTPCLSAPVLQNQRNGEIPEFCILIKMVPRLDNYHSEVFFFTCVITSIVGSRDPIDCPVVWNT